MILRFATGTAGAFIVSEAMGWYPSFLPPLLAGVLLANLPTAPPFKLGVVLILVEAIGSYGAYILTSLLHEAPVVLFGIIALLLLFCFATLTKGKAFLPILLVLISFSTVPIVTMLTPEYGGALPLAFTRGMLIAVVATWLVHAAWPKLAPPTAPPAPASHDFPLARALTGVAIVLPLMLVYLMYGITDALPVLITTVVLVINFDPARGAMQGAAMMIGNFIGGMVAILSFALLQAAPSLATLSLITFLVALAFAGPVERGGPAGAVALITFNQAIVLFSLALAPGGSSSGLWVTRLVQFGIACTFAVGMMSLLFPRLKSVR
jgi:vacuolar-type H+-ATPase subunit I/STV1